MEIELNKRMFNEVKAAMSEIKNGYKKVLVTSINKTLTTTKVQATARIGNELNLKAGRIKQNLSIQKANYDKISGALISQGEPIGLINFSASSVAKGVTVKVLRSESRSLLKHAYIATGRRSTKQHVFWRKDRDKMPQAKKFPVGKKSGSPWPRFGEKYRLPAVRLTGPRIEDIFANKKVFDPVSIQANHLFLVNVDNKITDILRRVA